MHLSKSSAYTKGEECRRVIKSLANENDANVNLHVVDIILLLYISKVKCGSEDVLWKRPRKIQQNTSISCE